MKFSVVIPVYNVAPYLRECLRSVIAASDELKTINDKWSTEIICIDDCSTDGSGEILDELSTVYHSSLIVYHLPANAGVSAARNKGIEVASGGWVWFVDGDDMIHPESFKVVGEYIAKYSNADIIKIKYYLGEEVPDAWGRSFKETAREITAACDEGAVNSLKGASLFLMRRELIGDIRFEHFRWVEDVLFVTRYLAGCRKMLIAPDVLYFYRKRIGSAIHSRRTIEQVSEIFCALVRLIDVAETMMKNHPEEPYPAYWKALHAYAYFGFAGAYFSLCARERKALLSAWLNLQDRFRGRYRMHLEWRVRIALVRLFNSGLLVKPLVLWGATFRGKIARLVRRIKERDK